VHPAVSQLLVQHEMVQLLCLQLACVVQQMQRSDSSRNDLLQQQMQGNSPAEQLLAAICIPAGFYGPASIERTLDADHGSLAVLITAFSCLTKELDRRNDIAAESGSAESAAEQRSGLRQPQVAAPLSLVLLQLCAQLAPTLHVMEPCLRTLQRLLALGLDSSTYSSWSAASSAEASGTTMASATDPAVAAAAAAEAVSGDALGTLLQRLLCMLGPALMRAVRKLDSGWSEEEYS
jgi:hypothetical protein